MMCRICEEDIRADHLKEHSRCCARLNDPELMQLSYDEQLNRIIIILHDILKERQILKIQVYIFDLFL